MHSRCRIRLLVVVAFTGASAGVADCGGSGGPTGPTAAIAPTYTISGVVTTYGGGPLAGANVTATPYQLGIRESTTQTDSGGRYSLSPSTGGKVSLSFWKDGYRVGFKNNVSSEDATANLVLQPRIGVSATGDTVTGTIVGDDIVAGDDVLFGGVCAQAACQIVDFDILRTGRPLPSTVEVRLRSSDPSRPLALYVSRDADLEDAPFRSSPPDRYCCSPELVAVVNPFGQEYGPYIAVAFEGAVARAGGASDSQDFELIVKPIK